jgi:hypothetical protein
MIRTLTAYLAAVLVTYVVAAFAATQSVMNALQGLGAPVTAGVRLDAAWHDLLGMASSYLPIIAIALLIAFPVAALICRAGCRGCACSRIRWPAPWRCWPCT